MGDELPACICNIILFATASEKFRNVARSYVQPGMHGVCLLHGIVGAVHYASKVLFIYYFSFYFFFLYYQISSFHHHIKYQIIEKIEPTRS